ncbi:unnamed protein product, partial [Prorocentrum cordatum]
AIFADPNDGVHYKRRSAANAGAGRYADALADAKVAADLGSKQAPAVGADCACQLGAVLCCLGKLQEALDAYDRGLKLLPGHVGCQQGRNEAQAAMERRGAGLLERGADDVEAQRLQTLPVSEDALGRGFEVVKLVVGSREEPLSFLVSTTTVKEVIITPATCAELGLPISREVVLKDVRFEGGGLIGNISGCQVANFMQQATAQTLSGAAVHGMVGSGGSGNDAPMVNGFDDSDGIIDDSWADSLPVRGPRWPRRKCEGMSVAVVAAAGAGGSGSGSAAATAAPADAALPLVGAPGGAAAAEAADPARGAGGAAGAAGCGLGCDGQVDGAARRRRGPRRPRAKAAAELGAALAVAAPATGGTAASEVGPEEVFAVADGVLRQAADYEPRLSEQLRQMLESVSWGPARRKAAFVIMFLLCSQEVLAARSNINLELGIQAHLQSLGSRSSRGPRGASGGPGPAPPREQAARRRGAELGPDALGRLEVALDSVLERVSEWHQSGGKETSLMELEVHLSRSGLSTFKEEDLSEARRELERHKAEGGGVENLNLFLCKRTRANGYTDEGWLFQDRKIEEGSFEVKCTSRVNVLHRGTVEDKKGSTVKEELMIQGVNALKAHTKEEFDSNFPIRLKVCRARGGCNRPLGESRRLVDAGDDVFGNGGLHTEIPIPDGQAENLWRESHQESHLYAVCYDQQDECDGVMWTPKNFDMCNGWFEADDARATLGIIGEAIKSGSWMDFWKPGPGPAGGSKNDLGPVSEDLAGQAGIDGEDLSMADGLKGGVREHSGCPTSDFMVQQEMDSLSDNKDRNPPRGDRCASQL